MGLSNLFGDVETQPETSEMLNGDGSLEAIKNPLLILLLDADAVISDDQLRTVPCLGDNDFNWLSGTVFHGVREQVGDGLFDSKTIPSAGDHLFCVKLQGTVCLHQFRLMTFHYAANHFR